MEKSRIIELMAKKIGKDASPIELQELADLLVKHPDYAYLHEIALELKAIGSHDDAAGGEPSPVDRGWSKLEAAIGQAGTQRAETSEKRRSRVVLIKRMTWAAAVMAVFATAGMLIPGNVKKEQSAAITPRTANAQYGKTSALTLSDGTKVWLNSGSRLIYPQQFSGGRREVSLEGEAFFEVVKNSGKPFLVHAGKMTIRVLGTRFNVRAYKDDARMETTLITGKVQVLLNEDDPENGVMLAPREKLTVVNRPRPGGMNNFQGANNELRYEVQSLRADSADQFMETAWMDNKLVISNDDFEKVARMLERKYDVEIDFEDNRFKQEHLSGVFKDENIHQVLDILKMTTPFNYRMETGNRVFIY